MCFAKVLLVLLGTGLYFSVAAESFQSSEACREALRRVQVEWRDRDDRWMDCAAGVSKYSLAPACKGARAAQRRALFMHYAQERDALKPKLAELKQLCSHLAANEQAGQRASSQREQLQIRQERQVQAPAAAGVDRVRQRGESETPLTDKVYALTGPVKKGLQEAMPKGNKKVASKVQDASLRVLRDTHGDLETSLRSSTEAMNEASSTDPSTSGTAIRQSTRRPSGETVAVASTSSCASVELRVATLIRENRMDEARRLLDGARDRCPSALANALAATSAGGGGPMFDAMSGAPSRPVQPSAIHVPSVSASRSAPTAGAAGEPESDDDDSTAAAIGVLGAILGATQRPRVNSLVPSAVGPAINRQASPAMPRSPAPVTSDCPYRGPQYGCK